VSATAGVGHGLGEITGLVWAGCLTEPDAARLVAQRAALLTTPPAEQTALVCVDADGPAAERLCAASGLVIAAYNGPRCHVLAGPAAAVGELARSLAEDGIPARLLDSPQAWYSPAMADRVAPMRGVVREFSFQPPSRRLVSTITGAEVTAGDDAGELLCTQLTSPVAFAGALGLAIAGADLLIETGPGQTLSCLAADYSDMPAISLAAGPADDGATAQVAAALFAAGAVATLAPLAAAGPARPIDIWRERVFIPSPCGTAPPRGMAGPGTTAQAEPAAGAGQDGAGPAAAAQGAAGQAAAVQGAAGQAAAAQGAAGPIAAPEGSPGAATAGPAGTEAPEALGAATAGAGPGAPRTAVPAAGAAGPGAGAPGTGPSAVVLPGAGGSAPAASGTGPLGAGTSRGPGSGAPAGSPKVPAGNPGAGPAGSHSPAPDQRTAAGSPPAAGEAARPTPASPPGHRGAVVPGLRGDGASSRAEGGQRGRNGEASGTPEASGTSEASGTPEASGRTGYERPGDEGKGATGEGGTGRRPGPRRRAGRIERLPRDHEQELPGAGPWIRCFTEEPRPARLPEPPGTGASWRLSGGTQTSFGKIAERIFPGDPAARTVLVLVSDPAEPVACAALPGAAAEAASTGRLVVITAAAGLTGLCASLHAEHPGLGVTLIRTVPTTAGLQAARRFAAATPGQFREVILDEAGVATEPVMVATDPAADGTFPLGPADVVLVTGVTRAGDLACATSLASRGAALAVLAPPGPEDPQLTACLAQLRAAGARVSRKKADLGDPGQVAAAVRSLERGLGPVTAVVHGAASGPVERFARLSEPALRSFLASQRARFSNVARAVAMERLRVLVTFGSVAARYGRAGGGCEALASSLLAEQAWRLAGTRPRCRVLHIDWAPWAGPEPATGGRPAAASRGLPPDTTPIPVEAGSGLLLSLLTTPDIPARVAVHGRLGVPAPQALRPWQAAPRGAGRFLETVRVHYPGVELVADARLSLQTDPYLADYRIDGAAVFGAAMVLEAMAQAASALAGGPQRHLTDVSLTAPVVLPAGREQTVVRVCAVRTGDTVTTVLRCAETGFLLDHAHAVFGGQPGPAPRGQAGHGPAGAASADRGPAGHQPGTPPGGMVDGTDLYGQIFFQAGRFRRVAFLPEASSRACRALVRGGDDQPWFGAVPGPVDTPLVLGSPGLNDATLHVLQACLPHRRLLPTGCESVTLSGREVRGALRVQAVRRPPEGGDGVWDVTAADATGQPVVSWRGVRSQGMGALARTGAWHPALLAISVESRAAEFGLDPSLRAVISCGTPLRAPGTSGRRDGDGCADTAVGRGPLDGFELTVQATRPVACRWQAVGVPREEDVPLDEGLVALRRELEARPREALAAAQARLATIAACLAALGREPGTPLTVEDECDGGWIVVRSRDAAVACAVTEISGVPSPVAVSIASRLAQPGADGGTPPVQRGQGEPIGSLPLANFR
jgi:enediyne polyketide synthase